MKKVACMVLILTMAIFLINPLSSDAGGPGGGHGAGHWGGGGHGGWIPWAILGTIAILVPYFSSPPVIAREQPPVNQPAPSATPSLNEKIFIYPRQGQNEELQAKDRYECHGWAVDQIKYDPTQTSVSSMPEAQRNQIRADYLRALGACLDGRGYTMR